MTTTRTNWGDTLTARRLGEDPDFHGAVSVDARTDEPETAEMSWDEFKAYAKSLGVSCAGSRATIQARIDALEED